MDEKKPDKRVVKTKKNIKDTFLLLLETKPLHQVRVQEILDRAQINRATFYHYYSDKYDLADKCASEFLEEIRPLLEKRFDTRYSTEEVQNIIRDIYAYLRKNRRMVLILWANEGNGFHLYKDMEDLLQQYYLKRIFPHSDVPPEFQNFVARVYSALVMTTIKWHLEEDRDLDSQKLFSLVGESVQKYLL